MTISRTVLSVIGVSVLVSATMLAQETFRRPLRNHVPKAVNESLRAGPMARTAQLRLSIGLPLRNKIELDRFVEQLSDVKSPNYRKYLNSSEFAERFGPSEQDYAKLTAFVTANGLKVVGTHPSRMLLDVMGPVSAINAVLHVTMTSWDHKTRGRFFAPDQEPRLDVDLDVLDISGTDNFSPPKPMNVKTKPISLATPRTGGSGSLGMFLGKDFRSAYAPGVTLTGAGQSIGMIEFDGFFPADLTANFAAAHLPVMQPRIVLLDGFNGGAGDANIEVILDIMMAAYMAPGAELVVYEGVEPNSILSRMADDNTSKQLSSSWCFWPINDTTEQIFLQMIAQGQSYLQASGDDGAYTGKILPPSDNPNVTVVGGTSLTTTPSGTAWSSEAVWGGSGGGPSLTYPIPSYQQFMMTTPPNWSSAMRNVPDVAMVADVQIFLIYNNGKVGSVGGTSAATPLWTGFIALANQQAVASGKPVVGFLNPTLYNLGNGTDYAQNFHDITYGSNGYSAVAGYDLATGWGSPTGQALIDNLSATANLPSFRLTASPNFLTIQAGASATSTLRVTGQNGFSDSVDLSVSGLPSGIAAMLSPSTTSDASTIIFTASPTAAAGITNVAITGISGSYSTKSTITLTVGKASGFKLYVGDTTFRVSAGSSDDHMVEVFADSGFNGIVALRATGLPAGVTAEFTPAETNRNVLSLKAPSGMTSQTSQFTVTGTSGFLTSSIQLTLRITAGPDFSLAIAPGNLSLKQGAQGSVLMVLKELNGFNANGTRFTFPGLPSGVTATTNGPFSQIEVSFTASSSASLGLFKMSISMASVYLVHTAPLDLTVTGTSQPTQPGKPGRPRRPPPSGKAPIPHK